MSKLHTATHPAKPIRSRLAAHCNVGSTQTGEEAEALLALLDVEADTEDV